MRIENRGKVKKMWGKKMGTETREEVMRRNGQDDEREKQGTFEQAVKTLKHSSEA